jgi:DNA-binding NarL/FixJ family response regulator
MDEEEHARTVALLHEDALARRTLRDLVQEPGTFKLVAELEDSTALKRTFAIITAPQALLMSLEGALEEDCALLAWLRRQLPTVRVVVLGPEPAVPCMVRLLRAGACGFCCTRKKLDRLTVVVEQVLAGALHYPESVYVYLRTVLPEEAVEATTGLSDRQREVLIHHAKGNCRSRVAIAKAMNISASRVHDICRTLCKRYKVSGTSGLVKLALRMGLGSV